MLLSLTRKLCPLITLAIATMGCGKKIVEADTKGARITEGQERPSLYILELDGSKESSRLFKVPQNAQFQIPDRLIVKQGTTTGKSVDMLYNVYEEDTDIYDFRCIYKESPNPVELLIDKCVNEYNQDIGYTPSIIFTIERDQLIQMRFSGAPAPDLFVEAIFGMDWK
jgi:hypothetical protein